MKIRKLKIKNYQQFKDIELDFTVIGFLAEVSKILAEAEISIVALSGIVFMPVLQRRYSQHRQVFRSCVCMMWLLRGMHSPY